MQASWAPPTDPTRAVVLRQVDPPPNGLGVLVLVSGLLWLFAGFGVYWLRTGETTVAAGTMSTLGAIVWLTPLFVTPVLALSAPRGPLWRLHEPPWTVRVDEDGLAWERGPGSPGSIGSIGWDALAGVAAGASRYSSWTIVRDVHGRQVVQLTGMRFRDEGTGDRTQLASAIVAARPDRYELVKARFGGGESAVLRSKR